MYNGMFVTDLDGTLIHGKRPISSPDLQALEELRTRGMLRVIATGRSLFSARRVLDGTAPNFVDYLVFSSGAGILDWKHGELTRTEIMYPDQVEHVRTHLMDTGDDFMVHDPIPHNHRFVYYRNRRHNPDFLRRLRIYRQFAVSHTSIEKQPRADGACQVIVIIPPRDDAGFRVKQLRSAFPGLSVLRTTSPIDGRSTWIELFPSSVSKAQAAEHLRFSHRIPSENTAAIGNDYNDDDLLAWAYRAYVMKSGPDQLTRRYPTVTGGLAQALRLWLGESERSASFRG